MTEIMPFPENNYETVLLDRPEGQFFYCDFVTEEFSGILYNPGRKRDYKEVSP